MVHGGRGLNGYNAAVRHQNRGDFGRARSEYCFAAEQFGLSVNPTLNLWELQGRVREGLVSVSKKEGVSYTFVTPELGLGTVSHGTFRTQDLLPVFLETLSHYSPINAKVLKEAFEEALETVGPSWWGSEEALELLDTLVDNLDACAPAGAYFGALEGDGSDFGFWIALD